MRALNDDDAAFWLFLNRDITEEALFNLYSALNNHALTRIDGTIEELAKDSMGLGTYFSVVKWSDPDGIALFLHNMEGRTHNYLFDGQRQLWLTIPEDFSISIYKRENKNDFTPVFQIICERVYPIFAFGGHKTMMTSDIWYLEEVRDSIERAISLLGKHSAYEYRTMFFDPPLYNSLPKEAVSIWGEVDLQFGKSGHLVSSRPEPFDVSEIDYTDLEEEKNRVFKEHILPHIRERFYKEYASLGE